MRRLAWSLVLSLLPLLAAAQPAPIELAELNYPQEFFPATSYNSSIPTPAELLGFELASRAAFPAEIEACIIAWAEASPRARLVEYARSHEGRALYYVVVSSEANMARLDEIQARASKLADGRSLSASDAAVLIEDHPAVAWMAYSIHGDETSGSDGSLAVLYHLLAGTSDDVTEILDNVVVLIDPMQNPDGRHRFLQQLAEHRAVAPNVDDQSLLHGGYWPWGRTNHYLFDLNRDWALGVNPEARGRIAAAGSWHPQLMVDAHEMGSQDTFLFSPARGPLNPHLPTQASAWNERFARDQAAAFDEQEWVYYTGEWNEGWYPGYTDAWGALRGAIGILYEQASFAEDGVRRPGGDVVTYREAVHHQALSSIANLTTLSRNRVAVLRDYAADRRAAVASSGPYADRIFAVLPTPNLSRLKRFVELAELQGFELHRLREETKVGETVDQLGRRNTQATLPAGTLLIANRQPEARLVATMLGFDERMPNEYLSRERTSILRGGRSTIYDLTAWNLTMLHGLGAVEFSGALPGAAEPFTHSGRAVSENVTSETVAPAVAWIVDGADDASVAAAARLMESGVAVRVSDRAIALGDKSFARGSVVVLPADNRRFDGDLAEVVASRAAELGIVAHGVSTGLGEGDLPDLGGGHFGRLEPPRIALLARGRVNPSDYGSIWYTLDKQLGIRHSQLDVNALSFADLRRYNVVVLPDAWSPELGAATRETLKTWVESGGTLIAIGGSAAGLATEEAGLSQVRRLRDVLEDLDAYESAVLREAMARQEAMPAAADVWSHSPTPDGADYPWEGLDELARPEPEKVKRNDAWDRMFMPQGSFLAARIDDEHWLTSGIEGALPVLVNESTVLMTKHPVETPVRLGVLEPSENSAERIGWSVVPKDHQLRLRMSGLLWPEAAGRLANSAAVTRESVGHGQIILFANPPTFRASTHGTARLLLNAMIYGPGLGASDAIKP